MYRVLIADDEAPLRAALRELIDWKKIGCEIACEARDGVEALDCMRRGGVDIAILDIRMPGLSGLQVCALMRQENLNPVVLLLTAYSDFALAREALRQGVLDYVIKSSFEEELPAALLKAVEQAGRRAHVEAAGETALRPDSRYTEPVNQVIAYLRENYARRIKVSDIADSLYMNQSYLCRLYKRQTGSTIMEDLTRYRIDLAKERLAQGKTVGQAAVETGFESAAYFTSVFTRAVGISPGRYRKELE